MGRTTATLPLLAMALSITLPCSCAPGTIASDPLRIDSGLISGTPGKTPGIRVYAGIPFAAPPVGNLRWRPPQPVSPWQGVRDCSRFGPSCPQPKPLLGGDPGVENEDCLYLIVWTPAADETARLPVMVWIHGGGCTTGSGAQPYYNGEALAKQGVVLVTINYRLGPFGFFAHPLLSKESEHGVSGNYGFLDQIAALKWVQANIARFGGDPGCVTIFGESAGSASVCRLMISPLAKGLFHRAIAESGGAGGRDRHLREAHGRLDSMEAVGEQIAAKLGCDKAADPLAALRVKTPEELLAASNPAEGLFGKGTKFGWVVDGWAIPDDPAALFAAGKQCPVPLMTGTNADEGTVFLQQLPIRSVAGYRLTVRALFGARANELLNLFPANTNAEVSQALNKLVTVAAFVHPARNLVRWMPKVGAKAYLYQFTCVPPMAGARGFGAFHSAEISYVFENLLPGAAARDADRALSRTMSAYWVHFARTGDPNTEGLPAWPAYEATSDRYMELGDQVRVMSGLYKQACDLLDDIGPVMAAP